MIGYYKIGSVFLILGLLLSILAPAAYADLNTPDTVEIEEVRCWKHMLEPDDVLIVARYNVHYGNLTAQPYQSIDQTFRFAYGNSTGTELGNSTAYPFFNFGYVKGLAAFYWAADDEDKPVWGDLGNVTITGTALFDSPPTDTLVLTSADWTTGEQPSTQREDLRQWLLNQLIFLEVNWNSWCVDRGYTDRQVSLTATVSGGAYAVADARGEAYLGLTIPNITSMCNLLFMSQTLAITHTERDWTLAQQDLFEAIHADDPIGELGEVLAYSIGGIDAIWALTLLTMAGCIAIIIICQAYWQKLNAGLLIAYVLILLATPEGLFQMGLMALFALIAVLYLSDIILTSRHQ